MTKHEFFGADWSHAQHIAMVTLIYYILGTIQECKYNREEILMFLDSLGDEAMAASLKGQAP